MGGFNFPLVFVVAITGLVAIPLLFLSDLSKWVSFLLGLIIAVFGLFSIDLILTLVDKQRNRKGRPLIKTTNLRDGQGDETEPDLSPGINDLSLPKAPEDLHCPSCDSLNIAVILYGLPALSAELDKALADQQVTLGGCLVYDGAPQWLCTACNNKFGALRIYQEEKT